jgi:choline dehydrogenase-like flavoprotein
MIHGLDDVRRGFDVSADAIVVGSGAGGAVAAANLSRAGLKVVVVEAGPRITKKEMTRDAPKFLARYFWEGGLRIVGGTVPSPSMHARVLGGNSVVNSAIMFELPDWVKSEWGKETGIGLFESDELKAAYQRVFERTGTAPTPTTVLGRRNEVVAEAFTKAGVAGAPLPRAVVDCGGCGDCLTGCHGGRKQSLDRSYIPAAVDAGADVFTCSEVDEIVMEGKRAAGVRGWVVDPIGRVRQKRFHVRAPLVVMAAGTMHTPVLLQRSGIHAGGTVGRTLYAHIGAGYVAFMDEVVDPWIGATQGWGAFSSEIRGLKYEALWAPPSVLLVRWGGFGDAFLKRLGEVKHATCVASVYRAKVRGRVKARRDGSPNMKLFVPDSEARTVFRGLKTAVDAILNSGARYVATGMPGSNAEITSTKQSEDLLSTKMKAKHLRMALNHTFGSCRMSADPKTGTVDETGKVRGVEGIYLCDASIFPSPSSVNPQATVMALSDVITRRLGEISTPA